MREVFQKLVMNCLQDTVLNDQYKSQKLFFFEPEKVLSDSTIPFNSIISRIQYPSIQVSHFSIYTDNIIHLAVGCDISVELISAWLGLKIIKKTSYIQ